LELGSRGKRFGRTLSACNPGPHAPRLPRALPGAILPGTFGAKTHATSTRGRRPRRSRLRRGHRLLHRVPAVHARGRYAPGRRQAVGRGPPVRWRDRSAPGAGGQRRAAGASRRPDRRAGLPVPSHRRLLARLPGPGGQRCALRGRAARGSLRNGRRFPRPLRQPLGPRPAEGRPGDFPAAGIAVTRTATEQRASRGRPL
jgi:hypothetical protein